MASMSASSRNTKPAPPPPPPLKIMNSNKSEEWHKWKRLFRWYANSINLEQKSHDIQLSTFKSLIGPDALEIYHTFSILDVSDVDSVIEKFDEHFKPKINLILERYNLYKLYQKPDQEFNDFLLEVTNQVDACGFQSVRDEIILYKIIGGVNDEGIRNALLAHTELKYDQAVEICRVLSAKHSILEEETHCKDSTTRKEDRCHGTRVAFNELKKVRTPEGDTNYGSAVKRLIKEIVNEEHATERASKVKENDSFIEFYFEEENATYEQSDGEEKANNVGSFVDVQTDYSDCDWIADGDEYEFFESKVPGTKNETPQKNSVPRKRPKKPKNIPCEICGRAFSTKSDLNRHAMTHVDFKVTCNYCGKQFTQKRGLVRHIAQYHPGIIKSKSASRIYACGVCDYETNHKGNIYRHQYQHREDRPFSCDLCDYKCIVPRLMKAHMAKHTGEKPLVCSICQKGFMEPNALKKHMITHMPPEEQGKHRGVNEVTCEECGKILSSKGALKTHLIRHSGQKAFACSECGFRSFTNGQLKSHVAMVHSDERPFVCSTCGYSCKLKFQLQKHMFVHTGEKPYECDVCGRRFSQSSHVRRHMMLHTGDKPHVCEICGHRWTSRDNLKAHMKVHEKRLMDPNPTPQRKRQKIPAVLVVKSDWSDESDYSEQAAADAIIQWSEQVSAINSIEEIPELNSPHSHPVVQRNPRPAECIFINQRN